MKKKILNGLNRAFASVIASVCAVGSIAITGAVNVSADSVYEFEDGTLSTEGRIFKGKDREGNAIEASGGSFVFLQDAGETASVEVTVDKEDMYDIVLSTYTPYGAKTHALLINGAKVSSISLSENKKGFTDIDLGNFKLNAGKNTIAVKSEWGWTYIDKLEIKAPSFPEIHSEKVLSDKNATDETKRLMCYLADTYGNNILSGQQEIYKYGPHDFEWEFEWIKENTGDYPVVRGYDFLNCANILYGSEDGTVDRMIDWANNKNGINTASWHVTVPKKFSDYEQGVTNVDWGNATYDPKMTDFDTSKVIEEGTKENKYYMACLEALAGQIQKLQDAKVPLIFRPLHEAEGGGGETGSWFWWGKSGSKVYKELWKLTYKTLTEKYDLHNIIWEWNSYAFDTSADWYPGDEYVDIIGYDKYNCTDWSTGNPVLSHSDSAIGAIFYNISEKYNGKKMVAMAENDNVPTLANLKTEKAAWLYFCTWYDGGSADNNFLTNPVFNVKEDYVELCKSDYCVMLSEVPADLYKSYPLDGFGSSTPVTPPVTTEPAVTTTQPAVTTEPPAPMTTVTTPGGPITKVKYDDSVMKVGELREIYVYKGDVTSSASEIYNYDPEVIAVHYGGASYVVDIEALKPGRVEFNILAEGADRAATVTLIIENSEPVADPVTILTYDKSSMKIGETRTIKYNRIVENNKVEPEIYKYDNSSDCSYTFDIEKDEIYITALAAGTISLDIRAPHAAFPAHLSLTVEEASVTTVTGDPGTTTTTTTAPTTAPPSETTKVPETSDIPVSGTPSLLGDVDMNGEIGLADVITLGKFLTSSASFPLSGETAKANGDVNKDGILNSLDLSVLIEVMLGKVTLS